MKIWIETKKKEKKQLRDSRETGEGYRGQEHGTADQMARAQTLCWNEEQSQAEQHLASRIKLPGHTQMCKPFPDAAC